MQKVQVHDLFKDLLNCCQVGEINSEERPNEHKASAKAVICTQIPVGVFCMKQEF